jgi:hypothetical protein
MRPKKEKKIGVPFPPATPSSSQVHEVIYYVYSEIGSRVSDKNTPNRYRSLLIRTKQAAHRTNRPYQQLKQKGIKWFIYFL